MAVSSEVVVSSSKVTNYEGGLAVGRSNSDSAIDSGGHTPLERATISRIFKLDIAVAFNTDNLHPGSEVEVKQGLSTSSDGDYVECFPQATTSGKLMFVAYACSSCSGGGGDAAGIVLRISNVASTSYTTALTFTCLSYQFA